MSDMGTKQAAEKWGVSQDTVRRWCTEGKVPGATQDKNVHLGIYHRMQSVRKIKRN